jgi:hypothetical protein
VTGGTGNAGSTQRNKVIHVASLALTKTGDGLIDPKLVLSWALNSVGAPQATIGLLVPLRDSLAMVPQIVEAAWLRRIAVRKFVWAAGSAIQAVAVAAMAVALWLLQGAAAGWTVAGLIVIFALGRSLASVSYKDVLGKTVDKGERGSVTGLAGSVASIAVLAFGAGLSFGVIPLTLPAIVIAICIAAGLWLMSSGLFTLLREKASTSNREEAELDVTSVVSYLRDDPQLLRFTLARFLLSATALAPPFILSASHGGTAGTQQLASLGPYVLASSVATIAGSGLWGLASDRSSRMVLIASAGLGAIVLGGLATVLLSNGGDPLPVTWSAAGLFVLMMAYQGVRRGRSTHIVDMAPEDARSAYAAVSNTVVGLLLLGGGLFGVLAEMAGLGVVFALLAAMCVAGALVAAGLEEAQAS